MVLYVLPTTSCNILSYYTYILHDYYIYHAYGILYIYSHSRLKRRSFSILSLVTGSQAPQSRLLMRPGDAAG